MSKSRQQSNQLQTLQVAKPPSELVVKRLPCRIAPCQIKPIEYDFDIQHYSMIDLQKLFQLPTHGKFSSEDVQVKKNEFRERILTCGAGANPILVRQLNSFLQRACDLLTYMLPDDGQRAFAQPSLLTTNLVGDRKSPNEFGDEELPLDYLHESRAMAFTRQYEQGIPEYDRAKREIIEKPDVKFSMVMQNEFNPGKINPIHTPVITKCLNIDTRFRDNLYSSQSSDFMFNLPDRIRKVVSMQVSAYEFPVTYYSTSASYGNNFLNMFCSFYVTPTQDISMTVLRTIVIPDGNYAATDLIGYINSQLCVRSPVDQSLLFSHLDSSGIFNCIQFSLDLNDSGSGSGKINLQCVDQTGYTWSKNIISVNMDFTLDIHGRSDLVSITSKIGWNLGFIRPQYHGFTHYISDTLPDPASVRYLYLVVNDFNNCVNNNFIGAFNRHILNNNILARIPVNGQYFNILMENQLSQHLEPRKYFGPVDIQRLHIQILDDHGRILNMNNANFSLCLTFKCMYD